MVLVDTDTVNVNRSIKKLWLALLLNFNLSSLTFMYSLKRMNTTRNTVRNREIYQSTPTLLISPIRDSEEIMLNTEKNSANMDSSFIFISVIFKVQFDR